MKGKSTQLGWWLDNARDYDTGTDTNVSRSGQSVYLKSAIDTPNTPCFICKSMKPEAYLGKSLKFSAWLKTELQHASVQLWMRVDVDDPAQNNGCFDNMYKNRIITSTDWSKYSVQVKVPECANNIVYGLILMGTGTVWMDDLQFEAVD